MQCLRWHLGCMCHCVSACEALCHYACSYVRVGPTLGFELVLACRPEHGGREQDVHNNWYGHCMACTSVAGLLHGPAGAVVSAVLAHWRGLIARFTVFHSV